MERPPIRLFLPAPGNLAAPQAVCVGSAKLDTFLTAPNRVLDGQPLSSYAVPPQDLVCICNTIIWPECKALSYPFKGPGVLPRTLGDLNEGSYAWDMRGIEFGESDATEKGDTGVCTIRAKPQEEDQAPSQLSLPISYDQIERTHLPLAGDVEEVCALTELDSDPNLVNWAAGPTVAERAASEHEHKIEPVSQKPVRNSVVETDAITTRSVEPLPSLSSPLCSWPKKGDVLPYDTFKKRLEDTHATLLGKKVVINLPVLSRIKPEGPYSKFRAAHCERGGTDRSTGGRGYRKRVSKKTNCPFVVNLKLLVGADGKFSGKCRVSKCTFTHNHPLEDSAGAVELFGSDLVEHYRPQLEEWVLAGCTSTSVQTKLMGLGVKVSRVAVSNALRVIRTSLHGSATRHEVDEQSEAPRGLDEDAESIQPVLPHDEPTANLSRLLPLDHSRAAAGATGAAGQSCVPDLVAPRRVSPSCDEVLPTPLCRDEAKRKENDNPTDTAVPERFCFIRMAPNRADRGIRALGARTINRPLPSARLLSNGSRIRSNSEMECVSVYRRFHGGRR